MEISSINDDHTNPVPAQTAGAGRGLVNPPTVLPQQRRGTMPKPTAGRELPTEPEDPTQNAASAGVRGFADSATFGFAPAISGATTATIGSALQLAGSKNSNEAWQDTYRRVRDQYKATDAKFKENSPYAYGAGQVAGAAATSMLPGGIVAQGALSGLGHSDADLTKGEFGRAAADAAAGAIVSKVLGVGTQLAGAAGKGVLNSVTTKTIAQDLPSLVTSGATAVAPSIAKKIAEPITNFGEKVVKSVENPPNPQMDKLFDMKGQGNPIIDKVIAPTLRAGGAVKDKVADATGLAANATSKLAPAVSGNVAPQGNEQIMDFVRQTFGTDTPAGQQIIDQTKEHTDTPPETDKPGRVSASVPQIVNDENGDRWFVSSSGQKIKLN